VLLFHSDSGYTDVYWLDITRCAAASIKNEVDLEGG